MKKIKKGFTLLEVVICIGLIAMVGGFFSISGTQMIRQHRYQSDVKALSDLFSHFEQLSIAYGCDFSLELINDPQGVKVTITTDDPNVPLIKKGKWEFLGIKRVQVDGNKIKNLKYTLFSSGEITPHQRMFCINDKIENLKLININYPGIKISSFQKEEIEKPG